MTQQELNKKTLANALTLGTNAFIKQPTPENFIVVTKILLQYKDSFTKAS